MDQLGNDHAHLSAPSESSLSRRTLLSAAGTLGIAGIAFRGMPANAAASVATDSRSIGFAGADRDVFATMLSSGTPATPPTGVRWYLDEVTFPNTKGYADFSWPDITKEYNSPAHALVSIRPDIEMLNNGVFDAELYAFMKGAPQGHASLLTIWHECATMSLSYRSYPQKPELYRQGLIHLQKLAAGEIPTHPEPTNVKIGVVDINPGYLNNYPGYKGDPRSVYALWMPANLDWYGCDLYDNKTLDLSVYDELNTFREYINTLPGSAADANWPVNLPECNSRTHNGSSTIATSGPTGFRRSDFFHYAWAWLQNIGPGGPCSGLLGFWGDSGGEGSTWPPADTPKGSLDALIKELNAEYAHSSPLQKSS